MKRIFKACVFIASVILAACNDKAADVPGSTNNADSVSVNAETQQYDSLLLDSIDYNMDLGNLSYSDLRLLYHYPYAKHAFWFKEYELNARYTSLEWYKDIINETYYEETSYTNSLGEVNKYWELKADLSSDYWRRWYNDYDRLKESTSLTPAEKAFVKRVKARMAELEKERYTNVEGFKLYNAEHIVNKLSIMDDPDLTTLLKKNGFALQKSNYIQMFQLYEENDYNMVPSYVTTDIMLQLFSLYNRYVLDGIEQESITPALNKMCEGLYKKSKAIADTIKDPELKSIADFSTTYYAVALSLLNEKKYEVPNSSKESYEAELGLIKGETDEKSPLLETDVKFGYSLFKPRAQYTRTENAKRYFRTMMWLQTAYLCAENNGLQKALFMAKVFKDSDAGVKAAAKQAFDPLDYLMGEPNNIPILELSGLLDKLGIADFEQLLDPKVMDEASVAIVEANKCKSSIQPKIQISCQPKINFMPQRYVPDGDVLNMMADSLPNAARAYPRGVDVFDAFGIKAAKALNDTFFKDNKEWKEYPMYRKKASDKFSSFNEWNKTAYNKWIHMLVELQKPDKQYPGYMQTSSWQLKNLNSALASWSELKHNTVLYAVQPMCAECGDGGDDHLPDPVLVGYVEPNLRFWKTLRQAIEQTYEMAKLAGYDVNDNFEAGRTLKGQTESLLKTVDFLIRISEKELQGKRLTSEEYETIRTLGSNVEYMTLGFLTDRKQYPDWTAVADVDKKMPVVADIYTRNVLSCKKSGILHTAVGRANTIYVVVEINGYYYLTRGATFSYYEFVRPLNSRLTDEEWQKLNESDQCPNVPEWITPFMINKPVKKDNVDYLYSSGC